MQHAERVGIDAEKLAAARLAAARASSLTEVSASHTPLTPAAVAAASLIRRMCRAPMPHTHTLACMHVHVHSKTALLHDAPPCGSRVSGQHCGRQLTHTSGV